MKTSNYTALVPLREQGFTIAELMITLAIVGILASMAAPSFQSQMAKQRINDAASQWTSALDEARAESAIRREQAKVNLISDADRGQVIQVTIVPTKAGADDIQISEYVLGGKTTSSLSNADIIYHKNRTATPTTIKVCDAFGVSTEGYQIDLTAVGNNTIKGVSCS